MTILGSLRRSRRLIRSVLTLFVLAWLQTMAVPCVMAQEGVSHPAMENMTRMAGATQQAAAPSDMRDCIYCPDASNQPHHHCDKGMQGCVYPHDSRINDHSSQQQIEQLVLHAAFVTSSPFSSVIALDATPPPRRYLVASHSPRRPLTLTYCVQLK